MQINFLDSRQMPVQLEPGYTSDGNQGAWTECFKSAAPESLKKAK